MIQNILRCNFLVIIIIAVVCITNFTCSLGNEPAKAGEFALYLLEDEEITWDKFMQIKNKDSLKIKEWITSDMIEYYDYSSHILTLNVDCEKMINQSTNRIFTAVANGVRCYYGICHFGYNKTPVYCNTFYPGYDLLSIIPYDAIFYNNKKDIRNDERVKQALIASEKYQGGIEVTLDDIKVIKKSESPSFEYTVSIKNIDDKNLYIMDPLDLYNDRLSDYISYTYIYIYGDDINQRFSLSQVYDDTTAKLLRETDLKPENLVYIHRGETIIKTYRGRLYEYKNLPSGNYKAIFIYGNAWGPSKAYRTLKGGRVLCGRIFSNIFDITYSKEHGIVINNRNVVFDE